MIRRPPRSPLLPYTTLFRSMERSVEYRARRTVAQAGLAGGGAGVRRSDRRADRRRQAPASDADEAGLQMLDRKSTRLNSSHANISYAVFCLKKKQLTRTQAL